MARKKDLKVTVERQISDMLESKDEPSEGRMKLLALGIKMLAVNAKLEEVQRSLDSLVKQAEKWRERND